MTSWKQLILSSVLSLTSLTLLGQNVNTEWAVSMGGVQDDVGYAIAVDDSGNVYTTGYFRGSMDFDPGPGIVSLTSTGGKNIFIQKLDKAGNLLWAKQMGGSSNDEGHGITTDQYGNVYLTGHFLNTADLDPGSAVLNMIGNGGFDVYVEKLDTNGNLLWVKTFGGTGADYGEHIAVNDSGQVFTTGYFSGTVDFDPGTGTTNLTSAGNSDIFIQKLDSSGNFLWARTMGGLFEDFGKSIAVDSSGNVYATGYFAGIADFDPGIGIVNLTSNGGNDLFIQKLDPSGNFLWAKQIGSSIQENGRAIVIGKGGDVYSTGSFSSTVDFDPGIGTTSLTAAGSNDIYILKLDSSGNFLWVKTMGGSLGDAGYSISTGIDGNIYVGGYFTGTVDFDASNGIYNLVSNGGADIFVQKLDPLGNLLWAKNMGGPFSDYGQAITNDQIGNIWTTGEFRATADFDPNSGTISLATVGGTDVFVQKLTECGNTGFENVTTCNQYTWAANNLTYTSSGSYNANLVNAGGCDSLVTLNLTINQSPPGFDTISVCGNYVWAVTNLTYTTSGSYADTLMNAAGCDSVVTLDLTINNSTTGTDVQTACDSFTWIDGNTYTSSNNTAIVTLVNAAGCDSVVTLDLTINNSTTGTDVQTACDSFTWIDGNTYTSSNNTAIVTLTNAAGCDSVVTLDLTINNSTTGTDVQTACDSFTWIDGNTYTSSNNTAIVTLTNAAGCDSVVTLTLTVNYSTSGTDVQTACDSFTWIDGNTYTSSNSTATSTLTNAAGCDSVVTLNLTINNSTTGTDVQTACDSFTWIDGNTYTSSNNTAIVILTNAASCDSVVTLNLTIHSVDVGVTITDTLISSNESGATYQWLDCTIGYQAIGGETGQSYTPAASGDFAVEVTKGGCTDTSNCVAISILGVSENSFGLPIVIYPNPTRGKVVIGLETVQPYLSIKVFSVTGQLLDYHQAKNTSRMELEIHGTSGLYFLEVADGIGHKAVLKVMKE